MHREWKHDVSADWLITRRYFLCASDIRNLLADYKRIKEGKIELMQAQQFAKVYGSKQVTEVDTSSYGPMARGHIMEPYAVDEYNTWRGTDFHWWDDKIITNFSLGFSPDALDIPPVPGVQAIMRETDGKLATAAGMVDAPTAMLEIKSYEAGNHYQRKMAFAAGQPLEERWQIACGMAVCNTIEEGTVLFYAPQCDDMFEVTYLKDHLEKEIETIREIDGMWNEFCNKADRIKSQGTYETEAHIHDLYLLDEMTN